LEAKPEVTSKPAFPLAIRYNIPAPAIAPSELLYKKEDF